MSYMSMISISVYYKVEFWEKMSRYLPNCPRMKNPTLPREAFKIFGRETTYHLMTFEAVLFFH